MNPHEAWLAAYHQLEIQFDRASFDTWLRGIVYLNYTDDTFILGVRNSYALDMLRYRLYRNVRRVVSDCFGSDVELQFDLLKDETHPQDHQEMPLFRYMEQLSAEEDEQGHGQHVPLGQLVSRQVTGEVQDVELNPRYTFERFVSHRDNLMVYEAARAVAEDPTGRYNPLMIYGGVGLGKTHLLQAIAHKCRERGYNVIYIQSEAFTNDLVMAIRRRQQAMFRERYRRADVLIVDDVQFIAGKESTQEEFFHTFNTLYTYNKQIILASDRHPDQLATLEDRLRSRFAGGLICDVQPPSFETRLAIVEMWCSEQNLRLSSDVIEMVVRRAPDNIRELEGVFNQLVAKARFAQRPIDAERAQRTLERYDQPRNYLRQAVTVQRILEETALAFRLDIETLVGPRRTKRINTARQVGMYLSREMTDASLPQIGEAFGGRTHSTVLHSCNKTEEDLSDDPSLALVVQNLRNTLLG